MRSAILFSILFVLTSVCASAQIKEIVKILNSEQLKDIRLHQKDSGQSCGERYELVKRFEVEGNILSIQVRRSNNDSTDYYIEKQEVDLSKVRAVVKDINVIFETEDDAVTTTTTSATGEQSLNRGNMFFLYLSCGKENEALAERIVKAFKKAGWTIVMGVWAD